MRNQFAFLALALAACASPTGGGGVGEALDGQGPVVQTTSGAVEGYVNGDLKAWVGIPYAEAPVDQLRWQPPQPKTWADVRPAKTFGSICMQLSFDDPPVLLGSEDCLFLNIYVPANATGPLPVMVHLHGGGNSVGSSYTDEDARHLVERGVIVVTLNYRLGVFGFVSYPALTAEGNFGEQGALDQIAAVKWIKANIAAFGGNPDRIMLLGFSAGSFDTTNLIVSPLGQGLVSRAAIMTMAYWPYTGAFSAVADSEQNFGIPIADRLGCTDAGCLRGKLAADVIQAGRDVAGFIDTGPPVGGTVLPQPVAELLKTAEPIPILVGENREDDSGGIVFDPFVNATPFDNDAYVLWSSDFIGARYSAKARALYPPSDYDSTLYAYVSMVSDAAHVCAARALGRSWRGPTWRYLMTHVIENDDFLAQLKAWHGETETFLWRFFGDYPLSPAEDALANAFADYWTNFAKAEIADPNGAGLPTWPQTDAAETYQVFDDVIHTDQAYHVPQCDYLMSVFQTVNTCGAICRKYFLHPSESESLLHLPYFR